MNDSDESSILTRMSYIGTPDDTSDDESSILPIVDLCRGADLTLLVGKAPAHRFRVSRNTLCMASSVFCAMLTGKFIEAQKDEIRLEGDDPDAMLIVLRIAHLRFSEVPRFLPDSWELVELATICDKYDMVAICRPFIPGWMNPWLEEHEGDSVEEDLGYEDCLWTTWVFGYQEEFTRVAIHLSMIIITDTEGNCKTPNGILNDELLPLGIIGG
jgi:hypothetical protein